MPVAQPHQIRAATWRGGTKPGTTVIVVTTLIRGQVRSRRKRRMEVRVTIAGLVWAWEQKGLTAEEKLVLLALGDGSSDMAPEPNLADVAEKSDLDPEKLDSVLDSLRRRELIDRENHTVVR